jgi:Rho guanine nucleotide exchange factor 7
MRQMQLDMAEIKTQIVQERELRGHLQQILMNHLENTGKISSVNIFSTDTC